MHAFNGDVTREREEDCRFGNLFFPFSDGFCIRLKGDESTMKNIVIDAFGGDFAPDEIVKGALKALEKHADLHVLLSGDPKKMDVLLKEQAFDAKRLEILPADEVILTGEEPVKAIKTKKNSSLVIALQAIANKQADALVSAGSTGAVLAGAILHVGRIKGIKRPALAPMIPTVNGKFAMLLDCGANVDCKPSYLQQFALMGSVYMESVMNVKAPKVGLLNNGAEAEKGNDLTKHAYPLLAELPIAFAGNCEPRDIMSGNFDVIVADGFAGNVAIKTLEGTAAAVMKLLKEALMSSTRNKLGAALAKPAFSDVKQRMDYEKVGGAMLLGIDGGIIKAHGNAKADMIVAAIEQGIHYMEGNVTEKIREEMNAIQQKEEGTAHG